MQSFAKSFLFIFVIMLKSVDLFTTERHESAYIAQRELTIGDDKSEQWFNEHFPETPGYVSPKERFAALPLHEQLQMQGFRSKANSRVYTEAEDKAKSASRFAEDTMIVKWAKWFKTEYPGIPYVVDKVAQQRSKLGGSIHKGQAYRQGNPDINIQCSRGTWHSDDMGRLVPFHGAYIEQKKSDDIFYAGTKILKPGSDNHNIWQSLYHADLREQGYWVMFSISLEATQKMTKRYMDGNPYKQQVFEYYCKPEDYRIFEGFKHFNPVKERP